MPAIVQADRQDLAWRTHAGTDPQLVFMAPARGAGRAFEARARTRESGLALGEQGPGRQRLPAVRSIERQHSIRRDDSEPQSGGGIERDQFHAQALLWPSIWSAAGGLMVAAPAPRLKPGAS